MNLYENLQPGNQLKCKLHYHWLDRNLIDIFIDEDIEYIIWVTPNKNIPGNSFWIPNITLIDVKKYKEKFYNDTILYSQETLRSIEIPM